MTTTSGEGRSRTGLFPAVLGAAALLLTTGCASNHQSAPPREALTGCYQFERNEGTRRLGLPWGFELLTGSLEGWGNVPDARQARTATSPTGRADHPFHYWRVTESDSIRIGHPGGGGFSLDVAQVGQDLVGSARAVGDVVPPAMDDPARGPYEVVARRVICGAT